MTPKKLWTWLAFVMIASFAVLIYFGADIYRKVPPIAEKVMTTDGKVLYTAQDVKDGQKCMAIYRWTNCGKRLGTWRLHCSRLDSGLSASGGFTSLG